MDKESYEYFTSQGKSGGLRCKSCDRWINLPRRRKYETPIRWTKCMQCDSNSKLATYDFKTIKPQRKAMQWIDVEVELPKIKKRFIAKCGNGDGAWQGVVDVYFDPHIGWIRCEGGDRSALYVTHYATHPYIEEETKTNN